MSATTIMTSTLPMVVGTGVVARTTETMFGRKGRQTPRRKQKRIKFKIYQGKRGGRYILKRGRKIYI